MNKFNGFLIIILLTTNNIVLSQQDKVEEFRLNPNALECLSNDQRTKIWNEIDNNLNQLNKEKSLFPFSNKQTITQFNWVLRNSPFNHDPAVYAISAHVDHNPTVDTSLYFTINNPLFNKDYNCGSRTYDTKAGYNHQGTDIYTYPFGWNKMDNSEVEVVAGADGVIIGKSDGNFDRSCRLNTNNWNAIYVMHSDSSYVWYGHLKKNSTTAKNIGEYLGIVGSSGNSSGPHLHLEIYNANRQLIDPWLGTCNPTTNTTWWSNQRPYYDPAINKLMITKNLVQFKPSPTQDIYQPVDTVDLNDVRNTFFYCFGRDIRKSDTLHFEIHRPDNSLFDNTPFIFNNTAHFSSF